MKKRSAKSGFVLATAVVLMGAAMILVGGAIAYTSHATRQTNIMTGKSVCRLAAQSAIESCKSDVYNAFMKSIGKSAHRVGFSNSDSFEWFGNSSTPSRTLGQAPNTVTLPASTNVNGCAVRVRFGRVVHESGKSSAEVTIVATAVRTNPGGSKSSSTIEERVRFAIARSKVFNNAYFVNNYGWFQGTGCTANGDVRANGDMYLDSGCKINGRVYAAHNEELGVNGDVTNYGTMDPYSTYKSTTYGVSNMSRPLAVDPMTGDAVAGGYDAPASATTQAKKDRIHGNLERETEMPFIGDLTSENSDYRLWIEELRASDPSLCKVTQGGQVLVDKYYDGVGPSGKASLADNGVLILEGTQSNPIRVDGPVVVKSDVIIKGYVTGQGTIYSGRNIHIVGNIQYVNPPSWSGKRANADNSKKDMLGLMAKGNIVMGNYTESSWLSSIRTYLTTQPYVQQYKCDSTDDLIGYPETFGGSYAATEHVAQMGTGSDPAHAPGGWDAATGQFGKVREVELSTTHEEQTPVYDRWGRQTGWTTTTVKDKALATVYDRKYYESVVEDREISSRCSTITRIDAVLYNNHGIFGKLGQCTINGSLVCRNEGLQYSGRLYLNWDIRLYSGSSETVDNNQVGLARASDSPPTTTDWRLLPPGFIDFGDPAEAGSGGGE